ncbi:hypothetical protein [Duganella sp. BuS-21]|uniref:hypothetical protein n=1 Tax=Duganella sp. BuS-21 TaxID=2943848 RepID=UPI0035A61956
MRRAPHHTPDQLATMVAAAERENRRAAFWEMIPPPARIVAMLAARLPRERASDPLHTFTQAERALIDAAITMLASHLGVVQHCMRDERPAAPAKALH